MVHCKTGAAISQNLQVFFKLPPKQKQEITFTMLIYAPGCFSVPLPHKSPQNTFLKDHFPYYFFATSIVSDFFHIDITRCF